MNFVVVGAGAWGTAFALHLARSGQSVTLVPRRAEQAAALSAARENTDYLPGLTLPREIVITADLKEAMNSAEVLMLACPAQALRATCTNISTANGPGGASLGLIISLA